MFLTLLGNKGYSLMRDLCTPKKPVDKSYDELKLLLLNYIHPNPNMITERYKFKERKQLSDETIVQFITILKKMSVHCDFGSTLDGMLRDQLIWGLRDQHIKKRLLSVTLKKCVKLSLAMEAANNDVDQLDRSVVSIKFQKQLKFKQKGQQNRTETYWNKLSVKKMTVTMLGRNKLFVIVVKLRVILYLIVNIKC